MTSSDRGALESLKIDRAAPPGRRSFPWGWLLILALCAGGGLWWWLRPRATAVQTATAKAQLIRATGESQTLLNASGYVTARRAATVSAKVTGKVLEILVEEGMKVTHGQTVATLDNSNVTAGLRLAEAQLEASRRLLDETRPNLAFTQRELARFTRLRSSNAASETDIARAELDAATTTARIARQEADIEVASRTVDEWKQQVDDTIIRAPFDGVVTTKDAQPGEIISPMSAGGGFTRTGICTVVDMTSLEIEVDVSESYLNRIQSNQPAEATLDAYADWRIPCKVIAIIPTADRQKATVKVRVGFDALDPRILPDMGVKVAFQSNPEAIPPPGDKTAPPAAPVIVIPEAALTEINGRTIVWVFKEGTVERRAIKTSRRSAGEVTLSAGLNAGEKVILNPPATLTDGGTARESNP